MPSIVRTLAPSAWTARTVQLLTASSSRWTVHAPQLDVSQPTCVPVRPSVSRRKWTRSRRGSTSALSSAPFTVNVTRTEPAMRLLPIELGGNLSQRCGLLTGAAAVVGERQLREQEAILCFDVREAEGQVRRGDPDLDGGGPDLAIGLHQAEHDLVLAGLTVAGLLGHAQAAGADVARERRPGLLIVVDRAQVGRQDDRGAGERAALAEPERIQQRGHQL